MTQETLKFTEFETKFRVDGDLLYVFKNLMETKEGLRGFLYVQGPDYYYTHADGSFIRYRKAEHRSDDEAELTMKKKQAVGNNIIRTEVNLKVDSNDLETVEAFCNLLGYKFNFKIHKYCHIYKFDDALVCFYSVKNEKAEWDHFLEVEVEPELSLTEEEGWSIIRKWETVLAPLGISPQKRLKKSLFETYKREISNEIISLPVASTAN